MNLLKKQGFYNSITLYLGTAIGFFNLIILFQRFLTTEQIGYFNLLIAISLLYTQISSLGLATVITRYFPFYRSADHRHQGFPLFVITVATFGFLVVTACFLVFKQVILEYSLGEKGDSSLMRNNYYYIVPISFLTLAYLLQETFARATFRNILPAFLREVVLRAFTSTGILLLVFKVADFQGFITFYLIANILLVLAISIYNYNTRVFIPAGIVSSDLRAEAPKMIKFGLFSMLTGSAVAFIQNLDVVMLGFLTNERMVGIYSTFFQMGVVISLPARALNTTSYQLIAEAWKTEDLQKIGRIYHKTSVIQSVIGALLLVGLIVNKDFVLMLIKPEMAGFFGVFIVIGVGYLVDVTGGLNGAIVGFSKYYKVSMRFLLLATAVCTVLNLLLIPEIGIYGAALSYVITMILLNFSYWLYLKNKFGLQPFGKSHILIFFISIVCLIVGNILPEVRNLLLDMLLRSALVGALYLFLIVKFKVSSDIDQLYLQVYNKILIYRRKGD